MAWASSHNGGKSQVGPTPQSMCFLNLVKGGSIWKTYNSNLNVDPSTLNSDGYPTSIVDGGVKTLFYVPSDAELPWSSRYVITWTGGGQVRLVSGGTANTTNPSTSGRIEFTPNVANCQITVAINSTPVSDLKVFYKPYETRVNNGEFWDPVFLQALIDAKPGVIRFMDFNGANGTSNASNMSLWAHRKPSTYVNTSQEMRSSLYQSGCTYTLNGSSNDYAINLGGSLPTHRQTVTVFFPVGGSATTATCTFSIDNGVTKYPMVTPSAISMSGSSTNRRPIASTYATLVFDSNLQSWVKWGGDTQQGSQYLDNYMPFEWCLDLAATVGAHPWFVTHYLACDTDDFVTGLATYLRDNAPSWMIPRIEGPNELWNSAGGSGVSTFFARAVQLVRNGGATPDGAAITYGPPSAVTFSGTGTSGYTDMTIGANSLPVGSQITISGFTGSNIFGYNGNTATVISNSGGVVRFNLAPNLLSASWSSGGTLTPVSTDIHNWYGVAVSRIGQAVSAVYSNDRTKYQVVAGVQTGAGSSVSATFSSNDRLKSTWWTLNSGNSSNAAYNWVTTICVADYIEPDEYRSNQELIDAYNYSVTYSANATQQAAIVASYVDTLKNNVNRPFNLDGCLSLWSNWKVFATGQGTGNQGLWGGSISINKMTCYEGGFSPDFTTADATAAVTGATKDASGCVLTVPNTTNDGTSNSNSATSAFIKNVTTVSIAGVGGMTQLNGNTYTVIGVGVADGLSANQIRLNVDSSAFGAYTSGGIATLVNSKLYLNTLRNAGKFAPKLCAYTKTLYDNFVGLSGGSFVAEFPSQFVVNQSSNKFDRSGVTGDGGIWGCYDPNIYSTPVSSAWDGIRLYNNNKRRFLVVAS